DLRRWESSSAFSRETPVRMQNLAAHGARIRMLLHEAKEGLQGVFLNDGVRIQDEQVMASRLADGLVVRAAEPHVSRVRNQANVRKFLSNHGHAPIHGAVVDHEDLHGEVAPGPIDRSQGLLKE